MEIIPFPVDFLSYPIETRRTMKHEDPIYKDFHKKIVYLDDGTYDVSFQKKRYLLRKQTQLDGRLIKLYAEELGGNDFISLNYYPQIKEGLL
jgi:hypothetical protein